MAHCVPRTAPHATHHAPRTTPERLTARPHTLRRNDSERRRTVNAAARRNPNPKPDPNPNPNQELRDCQKDKETSGLEVSVPDEANLMHWKGTLKGPTGTPYEGGIFKIDIQLPADYPFVPPKVCGLGGRPHTHLGDGLGWVRMGGPTAAYRPTAAHRSPPQPHVAHCRSPRRLGLGLG